MRRVLVSLLFALPLLAVAWVWYWLFFTPAGALWALKRIPGLEVVSVQGSLAGPLELQGVHWRAGAEWVVVDHLDLDWMPVALWQRQVLVRTLRVRGAEIHLASSKKLAEVPDLSLPPMPLWSHLLHVRIEHLDLARLTLRRGHQQQFDLRYFAGELAWTGEGLHSSHFRFALPEGQAEGSLDLGWTVHSLKTFGSWTSPGTRAVWGVDWKPSMAAMGGPVAVRIEGNLPMTVTADLFLERHAFQLRNARVLIPQLSQPALVDAVLSLGPPSQPYRLSLHGKDLYLLDLPKTISAAPYAVDLQLEGNPLAYHGHIVFQAPKFHWQLAGDLAGNEAGFRMASVSGRLLGGLSTGGWLRLRWRPSWHVAASLTFTGVNPGMLLPHVQANLNGTLGLRLAKEINGSGGNLTLDLGPSYVYRQSLRGQVRLSFAPRVFRVDALDLKGPGLNLTAAGELERRIDFTAQVSRWAGIFPKFRGGSRISGWVAHPNGRWQGQIKGQAQGLSFDAYRVAALYLTASSSADGKTNMDLQAQGVHVAGEDIALDVHAQGTLAAFESRIEVHWRDDVIHLAAKVSRHAAVWNTVLQRLGVEGQRLGHWDLTAPVRIDWSSGRLAISTVSLADSRGASIRLEGNWTFADRKGQGSLHVRALPLDLASASGEVQVKGRTDLDLVARCAGHCTGDGDANLREAMLIWREPAGRTIQVPISSWAGHLHAAHKVLNIESRLSLAQGFGVAQATATLPISLGIPFQWPPAGPVQGKFLFNIRHSLLLAAPLRQVTVRPTWRFSGNLKLAGTWEHPKWSGRAALRDAAVFIPQAGITVTGIGAQLQAEGERLTISQFHATSGKGSIGGQGMVTLSGFTPSHYQMQVTGKDFAILNLPEVTAAVTPNITIEGGWRRIGITGDVTADQLHILGSQIGGVRPSADVVFVKTQAESGSGPTFDGSLRIALGNDAKVIMGGLQSDLQGNLQVRVQGGQPPQVEGVLHMVNGRYQIYGKNLNFTRGVIRFHGPPNLAVLDVLALRHIAATSFGMNQERIQAGVQVTGTLQSPQVRLYSVPAMSDTDVLSYLIFGYPASGLQSQNNLLAAAAGQLFSTTQATLFRQNLLGDVGFANLGTSSTQAEGLAGTMVTLGHYLTPHLYVSIGQSIFGAGTVARLRYRLTQSVELQTEGGTVGSGVDLYYRIDLP